MGANKVKEEEGVGVVIVNEEKIGRFEMVANMQSQRNYTKGKDKDKRNSEVGNSGKGQGRPRFFSCGRNHLLREFRVEGIP